MVQKEARETSEKEWRPERVPVNKVGTVRSPDHLARAEFRDSGGRPSPIRDRGSVPELPNVGGPSTVRFSVLSTVLGIRTANSSHYFRYISCVLFPIARQVYRICTVLRSEYLLYPFCDEVRRFSPQDAPGSKRDRVRLILTT
jgi:hypothetical protein